jgi:DNA primase
LLDQDGDLVNVKWWHPEWSPQAKKRGHKDFFFAGGGRPWLLLFPKSDLSRAKEPILIVEGEVEAMTALGLGFAAVTSTGGAEKWDASWGRLFGGKEVIIVPDLDPSGTKHTRVIVSSLTGHAKSIRVLNWRDLL